MASSRQQAARDLNKKLRLEKQFRPKVNKTFSFERQIYRSTILSTGADPVRSQLTSLWDVTLQMHYQRVAEDFLKGATASLERIRLEKELALLSSIRMSEITVTSINDMNKATNLAVLTLDEAGIEPSKVALSRTGSNLLKRKQMGRVTAITTTETQTPAETTKKSVAEAEEKGKKIWITVRDLKVRSSHLAVDGLEIGTDEIFNVGFSKLMYPGDYQFNPNILDVVNCRCAAIYS